MSDRSAGIWFNFSNYNNTGCKTYTHKKRGAQLPFFNLVYMNLGYVGHERLCALHWPEIVGIAVAKGLQFFRCNMTTRAAGAK